MNFLYLSTETFLRGIYVQKIKLPKWKRWLYIGSVDLKYLILTSWVRVTELEKQVTMGPGGIQHQITNIVHVSHQRNLCLQHPKGLQVPGISDGG